MQKLKYELDPHNRLVARGEGLRGLRRVLDGNFRISDHNTLTYHIKVPVPRDIKAPHQLQLKGTWSLTEDHQLRLTLDKWKRQTFGDQLTIRGQILDVQKNSLLFAVTTRTKQGALSVYILELVGSWQADKHNRLTFRVDKEQGRFDTLTLEGAWELDDNYQIVYRYQEEELARKSRKSHTLIFKGYWDIKDKARLSYVIDHNIGSGFDFNTGIGIFKDGYIKYELGIGLSRKMRPVKRTITLFGSWKLKRDVGLVFEIERAGRKIQTIVFGAEVKLTDKGAALFNLRNSLNRTIGAELELSRDIFKGDGRTFLRLLQSKQESAILAGAGWRW